MQKYGMALAVFSSAILLSTAAFAQTGPDVYRVNYFENANSQGLYPSEPVAIVDPGTNGRANLCANIYVLTPDEQLNECCGCLITPDQLLQFDVDNDLVANPANGTFATTGAIKIISSAVGTGGTCDPGHPGKATPTLREWITHYDAVYFFNFITPVFTATETEFSRADLSAAEESFLTSTCAHYEASGALSGAGICNCPSNSGTSAILGHGPRASR